MAIAQEPDRRMRGASGVVAVAVFGFLIIPILIIIPLSLSGETFLRFPPAAWSFRWYQEVFTDPRWARAAWNSIRIGVPVAVMSGILGTLAALAIARTSASWARAASIVILAPLMLPHVILAIGIYPVIVDLHLNGTLLAPIIGHTIVGIPYVFITVSAALRNYDFHLELAALTMGANQFTAFRRVTLPMIAPSVLSGSFFAFAASFDELMLALFLTGPSTQTLPRLIWDQLSYSLSPAIAAVSSIILAAITLVIIIAALFQGRKNKSADKVAREH